MLRAFFRLDIIGLDVQISSTSNAVPRLLNKASQMGQTIMTKYLVQRIETESAGTTYYASEIHLTARWLMEEYGYEAEAKRLEYTETICTAAATILGSCLLFRRMSTAFQAGRLPSEISCCALTALSFLGDLSRLKNLISTGVDVNAGSQVIGKPLQAAAARGHTEIGILLLESGADANSGDSNVDNTALQLACRAGHEEIAEILLNPKYGIQRSGISYERAILSAARGGNVELVWLLLRSCEIEVFKHLQNEMLHEASAHGAVHVVRMLLHEGVNVNSRDVAWRTPLQRAASGGYVETVRLLIARGADCASGIPSPIKQAAKCGYERVVQTLLDAGDDIHGEGDGGPLTAAVRNEKIQMIQYLLDKGISPHAESTQTAFKIAAQQGYERIVRMLADHGVDVNCDDHAPMLSALMFGEEDVVRTLLEFGAQTINVSECKYAAKFASGEYPVRRQLRY